VRGVCEGGGGGSKLEYRDDENGGGWHGFGPVSHTHSSNCTSACGFAGIYSSPVALAIIIGL